MYPLSPAHNPPPQRGPVFLFPSSNLPLSCVGKSAVRGEKGCVASENAKHCWLGIFISIY